MKQRHMRLFCFYTAFIHVTQLRRFSEINHRDLEKQVTTGLSCLDTGWLVQASVEHWEILPDPSGPFVRAGYDDRGMLFSAEASANDKLQFGINEKTW